MWCIPGGRREMGESYETTLTREIKEEYDIDIHLDQCHFLTNYNDGLTKVYLCHTPDNQEPKLGEGLAFQWMTIDEIKSLTLGFNQEGIIPVIEAALAQTG